MEKTVLSNAIAHKNDDEPPRDGPWSRVPAVTALDRRLSAGDWRVLTLLCKFAGRDGLCFPGQETLANTLKVRRQVVGRHLDRLESRGYFRREISHRGKWGAFGRTLYTIQYPPFPE